MQYIISIKARTTLLEWLTSQLCTFADDAWMGAIDNLFHQARAHDVLWITRLLGA